MEISKFKSLLLIFLVAMVSYVQLLWMQPWQDDNALMFKIAHINEPAGYLGNGLFGSGAYRFTATPYYFLYQIFGYNQPVFFLTCLIFYFLAASTVYFLFRKLVNQRVGLIAALIFSSGYIA